jgi:hypothetical protein
LAVFVPVYFPVCWRQYNSVVVLHCKQS